MEILFVSLLVLGILGGKRLVRKTGVEIVFK